MLCYAMHDKTQQAIYIIVFTYSHADLCWCAISGTVTSHHTDIVVLVVLQWQLDAMDGSVGSHKGGFKFTITNWRRDTDDVMINHSNWIPLNFHQIMGQVH